VKRSERIGLIMAAAALFGLSGPVAADTLVIDSTGSRTEGTGPSVTGSIYGGPSVGGSAPRTSLPYNTPNGALLYPQDTSTPPRLHSTGRQFTLTPPGQARPAARPARAPEPRPVEQARPAPKPEAKPAQPAPAPKLAPKPAPKTAVTEAPKAPASVEPPATQVTQPAPRPAAPAPAPAPKPAAKPAPAPAPEPKVAAVTPPVAAPGVENILFEEEETEVSAAGRAQLQRIADGTKGDPNLRIQVKAYADSGTQTDVWKRRTSLRRAQNVRRILLDNGIASFRILVRALGAPGPDDSGPGNRVDIEIGRR